MSRKTNQAGIDLVASFEGLRLKAYPDPASGGAPWTIGYGHTKGVKPGQSITKEQAEAFLRDDLAAAEKDVERLDLRLTDNQFAALGSFTFNLGAGNLRQLVKRGLGSVPARMLLFNHGGGKVMPGLTRRREAERDLFLK